MKISVLGSGMVGQTIAGKMVELGQSTFMATRNAEETQSRTEVNQMTGASFSEWHENHPEVVVEDFDQIPSDTDLFINATNGMGSIEAVRAVGSEKLKGKTILDIANPLDFSKGMPPSLFISNTDSLAEQLQREFPEARIVKGLNSMNCFLMVNPSLVPGDHNVFLSGNDSASKEQVKSLLMDIGWKESTIIDLGDITTARGTEMLLPIWIRLMSALGTPEFNFHIAKK